MTLYSPLKVKSYKVTVKEDGVYLHSITFSNPDDVKMTYTFESPTQSPLFKLKDEVNLTLERDKSQTKLEEADKQR